MRRAPSLFDSNFVISAEKRDGADRGRDVVLILLWPISRAAVPMHRIRDRGSWGYLIRGRHAYIMPIEMERARRQRLGPCWCRPVLQAAIISSHQRVPPDFGGMQLC